MPTSAGSGEEAQFLFSVPLGKPNTQPLIAGFGVGEDGTLWIIDRTGRLQRYSSSGKALADIDLSSHFDIVYDMEVFSNTVWIYDGTYVVQLAPDGSTIRAYSPFAAQTGMNAHQPGPLDTSETLLAEAEGEDRMLLWAGHKYIVVADQTRGKDGQLNPQPVPGYPAYGKLYRQVEGQPDTIMAGDVQVKVCVPEQISFVRILKVMPDSSFYVLVVALVPAHEGRQGTVRQYIMHYAADGTLVERARVPTIAPPQVAVKQLAATGDGTVYAAILPLGPDGVPAGRANILRLHFYPAAVPLPPTSTPDTVPSLPTPIPTAPARVPSDATLTVVASITVVPVPTEVSGMDR